MNDYVLEILLRRTGMREWRVYAKRKDKKELDLRHRHEQPEMNVRSPRDKTFVERFVGDGRRW